VSVIHGRAVLRSPGEIDVDGTRLRARRLIIATGAGPAILPIEGLRATGYLTNENVFSLRSAPRRLVVLGGGAIGCELAQAFARLGSTVVLVEAEARLLPREEPEASHVVTTASPRTASRSRPGRPSIASRPSRITAGLGSTSARAWSS
jgi:pyruvate/2-oxoglutarate dehydrogenase complex dihydrolipoamide dehydrogenase (E3) component